MPRRSWPALLLLNLDSFSRSLNEAHEHSHHHGRCFDARGFTNIFEKPRINASLLRQDFQSYNNATANFPVVIRGTIRIDMLRPCGRAVAY